MDIGVYVVVIVNVCFFIYIFYLWDRDGWKGEKRRERMKQERRAIRDASKTPRVQKLTKKSTVQNSQQYIICPFCKKSLPEGKFQYCPLCGDIF